MCHPGPDPSLTKILQRSFSILAGTRYIPVENFSRETVFLFPELLRAEIRGVYFVVLSRAICSVGCLKSKTFQGNFLLQYSLMMSMILVKVEYIMTDWSLNGVCVSRIAVMTSGHE